MTRALAVGLAAVVLLAIAGCGDSGDGDGTEAVVTVTEEVTASAATTDETTVGETTTSSTNEDGAPPPADREVSELTMFRSPTGNIGCAIDQRSVRCDIGDRDWSPPPKPSGCNLDFGQGITLEAGAAPEFVCAGDTTLGAGDVLAYGQSIAAGLLRCESAATGMTCTDTETGRGFMLAKESYKLF